MKTIISATSDGHIIVNARIIHADFLPTLRALTVYQRKKVLLGFLKTLTGMNDTEAEDVCHWLNCLAYLPQHNFEASEKANEIVGALFK